MIILPPLSGRRQSRVKVPPQKLLPAVAFELVMTGLGIYAMLQTGEPLLMAALLLVGTLPILWVVFSAAREQRAAGNRPIVEDARGRR